MALLAIAVAAPWVLSADQINQHQERLPKMVAFSI
jgi:hypothetical protein